MYDYFDHKQWTCKKKERGRGRDRTQFKRRLPCCWVKENMSLSFLREVQKSKITPWEKKGGTTIHGPRASIILPGVSPPFPYLPPKFILRSTTFSFTPFFLPFKIFYEKCYIRIKMASTFALDYWYFGDVYANLRDLFYFCGSFESA